MIEFVILGLVVAGIFALVKKGAKTRRPDSWRDAPPAAKQVDSAKNLFDEVNAGGGEVEAFKQAVKEGAATKGEVSDLINDLLEEKRGGRAPR